MIRRALAVAVPVFLLDRLSKYWIVEVLDLRHRLYIPVFDPWLNFTMAWNQGINFGLFNMGDSGRWFLIGLALAITVGLAIWIRTRTGWGAAVGAGAIMGGAIGNVWDRVQYGAVADFLNMSCCGIRNPFAFNIADAAIFIGAAILVIFATDREPKSHQS
ncbi:MAG: signal peptidase II [Pseudomonadota bacterium]